MKSKISAKGINRFKRRTYITSKEHEKILESVLGSDKPMGKIFEEITEERLKDLQKN